MKILRFWGLVPAFCLLALPLSVRADNQMMLGGAKAKIGNELSIPLTLTSTDEVQGLVAAFDWDEAAGVGADLTPGAAIADADTVVTRVEASYMVLGVVMDSDGVDDEIIPPGDDLDLATAKIQCGGEEGGSEIVFQDGLYNTVDGGPLLENIVVVGGLSIGVEEGLVLVNGSFECRGLYDRFYIDPDSAAGKARVLMDNTAPVEGYVVALCHDAAAGTLQDVAEGQAATDQAADFVASDIAAEGGWIGVVIDLQEPFTNNTIPAGEANHIATYSYRCEDAGAESLALSFCDNVLGDPLKENVIVVGGMSVSPELENGSVACGTVCVPTGPEGIEYGNCTDGVDNDCNGLTDMLDPGCQVPAEQTFVCGARDVDASGLPGQAEGAIGSVTPVCFYILNPEDNMPGVPQYDHIQGFSMALTFCCDIAVAEETLDISGTILEAIGAEYVTVQGDNDPDDGDGCELIIGVLVDALPPFDGATIPPTDRLMLMGCVDFKVKEIPENCGNCCPIEFTDGVNGTGKIPILNLISVENISRSVQVINCSLCITNEETFYRGDCNFSSGNSQEGGSLAVDIADAATVVSFLFAPPLYKPEILCLDACDCNDDGRIDLADAVCILRYLFQHGAFPPEPGPGWRETGLPNPDQVEATGPGADPTEDLLDCQGGGRCS